MVSMSNYNEDPIIEIFNDPNNDDNDIQIINRDNDYDGNLITSDANTSHNYFNELYDPPQLQGVNRNQQNNLAQSGQRISLPSPVPQPLPAPSSQTQESGLTPILAPNEYNQLTTSNPSKFLSTVPPLPPLSESVIPNGLSYQPTLSLLNKPYDKNDKKVTSTIKKRKENAGPKTRPAFVMKIWSMVNDPANQEYIRWNENGKTFQVFHREEFMKVVLPKYFKHNNFSSFVRQLNMYGWHKVQDINHGTLTKDDRLNDEIWQFENPYFVKGREDLLDKIVRNKSMSLDGDGVDGEGLNFQAILHELDQIKINQLAITEDLRRIRKDNKTLWNENYITRERHQQQSQTLEKILKFLAAVYGNSAGKLPDVDSGHFGLDEVKQNNQMAPYMQQSTLPVDPNTQQAGGQANPPPSPFNKPRLMLMDQAYQKSNSDEPSPKPLHKPSKSGSIEEIIRSYENSPNDSPSNNVNRMYQQLMNQDTGISSPRHFFPELNSGNPGSPYLGLPGTPGQQYLKAPSPTETGLSNTNDLILGLEQTVEKQGQSIQQVQDWIHKLAAQQKLQNSGHLVDDDQIKSGAKDEGSDDFDVNDFLNNFNASSRSQNVSTESTPESPEVAPGKRAAATGETDNLRSKRRK